MGAPASADAPARVLSPRISADIELPPAPGNSAVMRLASGLACVFALAVAGCTSGSNPDQNDGGAEPDGGVGTTDSGSQLPVGDGGPCVVLTTVPASAVPSYATVVQQKGACTATQISDFVTSCTSGSASGPNCDAFQTSSGNTGCMACLFPSRDGGASMNTGGVLLDATGTLIVGGNTPGCIALVDPANGPACAAGLEPLFQCETVACGSADCRTASTSVYQTCLDTSEKGACASQYAASSPCATEYTDGGAAVGACATDPQILNVICGAGM